MLKTNRSDICIDRYVYMLLLFYSMFPFCNHKELRSCKIYKNNGKNENEGSYKAKNSIFFIYFIKIMWR